MAQPKFSAEEWRTLVGLAERLGISLPASLEEMRFDELESAAHRLGRAIAQATTERLADERAEQSASQESCPTCGKRCSVEQRRRKMLSVDGPVEFSEPVAHCSACRRDFFPSAGATGTRSAAVQSGGE